MKKFSPKSQESKHHIRLPSLEVLHREDRLPECLALKASRAGMWERAVGNRDSTLKGHMLNLACSESPCRDNNLKGAPQIHSLILENIPERQEPTN